MMVVMPICYKICKDDVKLPMLLFRILLTPKVPLAQLLLPPTTPAPFGENKLLKHGMNNVQASS